MISDKSVSLINAVRTFNAYRQVILDLVGRETVGKYKGSTLGIVWAFANPLILLLLYTFLFSVVFRARWGDTGTQDPQAPFAIVLFAGMIVHSLLAECIVRAPMMILSNPNYVTKVIFPLEILPLITVLSALVNFSVSFLILLVACVTTGISITASVLLVPVILLPLVFLALGIAWFLASLGVFLRDISHLMGFVATALLFSSPVFFRLTAVPEQFRGFMELNPLTLPIENLRNAVLWHESFSIQPWAISLLLGMVICYCGFWWFQMSREGFADVL